MRSMLNGGSRLGLLLCLIGGPAALAQTPEPFHIRNLNPLVAIFGLPAWDTFERDTTTLGATFELANHYRLSRRGDDLLVLDGETLRTTLSFNRSFGRAWAFGFEAPYYSLSGGVLDDLVDGWHSAFGLPDGGRNNRPEDELLFVVGDRAGAFFELRDDDHGLGDVQLKLARKLGAEQRFIVQASLKAPTGDEDMLAGSGSADFAVTVLRTAELEFRNRRAGYYWGVGALRAGDAERIRYDAEDLVTTAIVGGSWQLGPRFGLKGQLDFHSPLFNTQLEELGEKAIQATAGAWLRPNRKAVLEFAVVEDLEVSTAPDVVVHIAARWTW
jgi:Protein of unknown function (DUF3187)